MKGLSPLSVVYDYFIKNQGYKCYTTYNHYCVNDSIKLFIKTKHTLTDS